MTKKLVGVFMAAFMVMTLLAACGGVKMPDTYSEQAAKDKATEVVNLLNAKDYQAVVDMYRADKKVDVVADDWSHYLDSTYALLGEPQSISKISVKTEESVQDAEPTAVVTIVCKYTNGQMTYNVALDGNNELIGWNLSDQDKNMK